MQTTLDSDARLPPLPVSNAGRTSGDIANRDALHVRAYAPASIGNVAAGFDVLGAAVAPVDGTLWGDIVELEPAKRDRFRCTGRFADRLPPDPADNLVLRVKARFAQRVGGLPPLATTLHKALPVRSGLGSSSASIVATLRALNAWCGEPLPAGELLALAGEAEGAFSGAPHLDNVAPALLGGLCLVTADGEVRRLPFPDDLAFVLVHPDLELATAESRAALPRSVPLTLAVAHAQNLAALVHGLHSGERRLIADSLRDLLAEPHRAPLIPAFAAVQAAARNEGAWGCSLSGSGPTVFAVAEARAADAVAGAMTAAFAQGGCASEARVCRLDDAGARILV